MSQDTVLINNISLLNSPPEKFIQIYTPAIEALTIENQNLNRALLSCARHHAPRETIVEIIDQLQHNFCILVSYQAAIERARADLAA